MEFQVSAALVGLSFQIQKVGLKMKKTNSTSMKIKHPLKVAIGKYCYKYRNELGFSCRYVGDNIGKTVRWVRALEKGEAIIGWDDLKAILDLFGHKVLDFEEIEDFL